MEAEQGAARHDEPALARAEHRELLDLAPTGAEQQQRGEPDAQRRDRERGGRCGPARERSAGRHADDREHEAQHGDAQSTPGAWSGGVLVQTRCDQACRAAWYVRIVAVVVG